MDTKLIYIDDSARNKIKSGINLLAKAVSSTLGPRGKTVIIENEYGSDSYRITKDGISVARSIKVNDPIENAVIALARESAAKTNTEAGDGTTTATILTDAIYSAGFNYQSKELNLKIGIDKAVEFAVDLIKNKISRQVNLETNDLKKIAKISANGDEDVATSVSKAFEKVGASGSILVEESPTPKTYVELNDGTQFPSGFYSPYFINGSKAPECTYNNPAILITDKKITAQDMTDIVNIIGYLTGANTPNPRSVPIVIIAEDFDPEIGSLFITNKLRGVLNSVLIKLPPYGEDKQQRAQDLALICDSTLISDSTGITFENFVDSNGHAGICSKITVTQDKTTIIGGAGLENPDTIELKNRLEEQLKDTKPASMEYHQLSARLNSIKGGVAVIRVGAQTETEMKEKRDRVDDAVCAAKAALKDGIVPGSGITLAKVANELYKEIQTYAVDDPIRIGMKIVADALTLPLKKLFENAGIDSFNAQLLAQNSPIEDFVAFDLNEVFRTGETKLSDAAETGIIDPTTVIVNALENAASIASLLLTTNVVIVKEPRDDKPESQQGMYA